MKLGSGAMAIGDQEPDGNVPDAVPEKQENFSKYLNMNINEFHMSLPLI